MRGDAEVQRGKPQTARSDHRRDAETLGETEDNHHHRGTETTEKDKGQNPKPEDTEVAEHTELAACGLLFGDAGALPCGRGSAKESRPLASRSARWRRCAASKEYGSRNAAESLLDP